MENNRQSSKPPLFSPIWCRPVTRTGPEPDFRRKVTGGWSWKSSKLSWEEDNDEACPLLPNPSGAEYQISRRPHGPDAAHHGLARQLEVGHGDCDLLVVMVPGHHFHHITLVLRSLGEAQLGKAHARPQRLLTQAAHPLDGTP